MYIIPGHLTYTRALRAHWRQEAASMWKRTDVSSSSPNSCRVTMSGEGEYGVGESLETTDKRPEVRMMRL